MKRRERKTVIGSCAGAAIEQLDEGMGIVSEEYAGNHRPGSFTRAVHKLEVPALEAGYPASNSMLEVEVLRAPDVFKSSQHILPGKGSSYHSMQ